jgi:hypothetical protein
MYEGIDTVVLQETLAFHDELPVEWQPAEHLNPADFAALESSNITLLLACLAVEEQPAGDKHEDLLPLAQELARLDYKINLVLQLLGRLLPGSAHAGIAAVRFNALGVSWQGGNVRPARGSQGVLHLRLRSALPESLKFAVEITASSDTEVAARHLHMPERLAELIQRFCFLQHRKEVAGARRSKDA